MSKTKRLTTDAVLVALYTVLTVFVSIKAGNLHISIASLPIVVCALLYGPADACMDALITNFHLPESTLIMLVSALAGRERILNAYKTAVEEKYRFFSFGDAMLIE